MKSSVTAQLYLVGNRVKHNTDSSKRFINEIEQFDNYLTYFKEKELFINAIVQRTSVDKIKEKSNKAHKNFYKGYIKRIETI